MENRTVLGDIDLLPGKHLVAMGLKATLLGEVNQELEGLVGNSVLGVVEEDPAGLGIQALTARRVSGKEFLEGGFGDWT